MSAKTGAHLLVQSLEAHGVKYIFCIPGAKIDKILDCLIDSKIQVIVCRHEQNAALIAQGIGKMTGKAGVCLVTSGPGCTNLATGIATADYEGDPIVALGGAVSLTERLKLAHQSLDTVSLFRPITKYAVEITHPQTITEVVVSAFRSAEGGRPGAAFIALPKDVMETPSSLESLLPPPRSSIGPANPASIAIAAEKINKAKLPVFLLGMQSSSEDATNGIRQLLEHNPMSVVCTFQGAGVVPREHLNCFGGRIGISHNQPGDTLLDAADLVITVGYNPIEYDPSIWNKGKKRPLIHIDNTEANLDPAYWPSMELIGDINSTVVALTHAIKPDASRVNHPELVKAREALATLRHQGANENGSPIHPLRLIYELQKLVNDNTTVICDVGSIYMWMSRYFLSFRPRHFLTSNGQQTLGVALPWAIAACLVRPQEKVLSMSGDGGFLFSSQELETAVRLKCNFVHLVWTDGFYNMVKIQQDPKYGRHTAVTLGKVDIVKYAEAFGAVGMRINLPSEIEPTLKKAFATKGPVLIDIPIDYSHNAILFQNMSSGAIH